MEKANRLASSAISFLQRPEFSKETPHAFVTAFISVGLVVCHTA